MTKFASTLLGLTLVTACSASSADAGLFDWFDTTHTYHTPRAAVSYTLPASNSYTLCGPDGCVPCVNGQCATPVRPTAPYGYNTLTPTYDVRTPNQYFPTSTVPTNTYYGSSYGNSTYGNPSYTTPCATGNCPTTPYAAPYSAPNAVPYHTPVNTPVSGRPYFGSY